MFDSTIPTTPTAPAPDAGQFALAPVSWDEIVAAGDDGDCDCGGACCDIGLRTDDDTVGAGMKVAQLLEAIALEQHTLNEYAAGYAVERCEVGVVVVTEAEVAGIHRWVPDQVRLVRGMMWAPMDGVGRAMILVVSDQMSTDTKREAWVS